MITQYSLIVRTMIINLYSLYLYTISVSTGTTRSYLYISMYMIELREFNFSSLAEIGKLILQSYIDDQFQIP
jgi:hypothetical protein